MRLIPPALQLISENYRFSPQAILALLEYKVVHQEVRLVERPTTLVRKYYLSDGTPGQTPLQITISLSWGGFSDAVDFLFGFSEALDLLFSPEKLIDTRKYALGDFGVAWNWVPGQINILAFVRNNVFVGFQGFIQEKTMLSAAKAIDGALDQLGKTGHYPEHRPGFFSAVRAGNASLSVPAGARLNIGLQATAKETFFFLTSSGCMNRDPTRPELWYFRAGHTLGNQQIDLFRVDDGILPQKESSAITIVEA